MLLTDTIALDGVRRTASGYLVASAKVARTGIQIYSGDEVGKPELAFVRVYRPEAEVFSKDTLKGFAHRPVTLDHPPQMVTKDNWKQYAKGYTADEVARDGEFIRVPLLVADGETIDAIEGGKRELSMGYTCDLKWEAGKTDAGEAYDATQTNIRANHLAVVTAARGGSQLRIGDGKETKTMKIMFDGIEIEATDQSAQAIVKMQKLLGDAAAAAAKLTTDHAAALAAKDAELGKKDAAIDELKGKVVSDADLDKKVQDRAALVTLAKAISPTVKTEGVADADIRRSVVVAKLGDGAVKDKPAAYIDARFDILAETAAKDGADPLRTAITHLQPTGDANDAAKKAHDAYVARMTGAWKGETKAA